MGWFRARARGDCVLALMALALQLVVAFGHSHPFHLRAPAGIAGAAAVAGADLSAAAAAVAEDDCAICATLNLARNADKAAPPALAQPVFVALALSAPPAPDMIPARRRHGAQSRAPPIA